MTAGVGRPPPFRLPPAGLLGRHVELVAALALLPVIRIWDLTGDFNTAVTTAGLFAAAGWLIWRLSHDFPPQATRAARLTAGVALAVAAWQLAWIDGNDFWFYRVALLVWAISWLLLWWGWRGLARGWRVLAAFGVWSVWCEGPWRWMRDAVQSGDRFGPALALATAKVSALCLRGAGAAVALNGTLLTWRGKTVAIGVPCTGLPLAKLLILLLALACLLFRMPFLRALGLAAAAAAIAFVTSVARVLLLTWLVPEPDRFQYWHEAGSGGQWFTAAAMVLLALLFVRVLPRVGEPRWRGGPFAAPPVGRWLAAGAVAMLAAARLTEPLPPRPAFTAIAGGKYQVVTDSSEWLDGAPVNGRHANEPAWIRRILCSEPGASARLELTLAYIPQMLAGDLRPEAGPWKPDPTGRYAIHRTAGRVVWVSTFAPDGRAIASADRWSREINSGVSRPGRWLAWLAHRRPLRDKRAYWAEAEWSGPPGLAPELPPEPFLGWIDRGPPADSSQS